MEKICCALFWVGRQWFFDLWLQFQTLAGDVNVRDTFAMTLGRPARGDGERRKRVTNAPQARDGKIILQSQQNFQSSEKCVGHESHSDSVPFFSLKSEALLLTARRIYWQENFPLFCCFPLCISRSTRDAFNGTRFFILITVEHSFFKVNKSEWKETSFCAVLIPMRTDRWSSFVFVKLRRFLSIVSARFRCEITAARIFFNWVSRKSRASQAHTINFQFLFRVDFMNNWKKT